MCWSSHHTFKKMLLMAKSASIYFEPAVSHFKMYYHILSHYAHLYLYPPFRTVICVLFSLFILLNPLSIFKTIGLVVVSIVSTPHSSRFHPTFPIFPMVPSNMLVKPAPRRWSRTSFTPTTNTGAKAPCEPGMGTIRWTLMEALHTDVSDPYGNPTIWLWLT